MGRRKLDRGESITKTITTYISENDYNDIVRICDRLSIKPCKYLRFCVLQQLKVDKQHEQD